MMTNKIKRRYTVGEEIANAITHGVGVGLSIAALVLLIVRANRYAPPELKAGYIVGFSIFGASLIILYLFSTLYHALPLGAKKVFQIFDHCSIYILIAGTYTAFCLTALHGAIGWTIFGIIWGFAIAGIVLYAIFQNKFPIFSLITYIVMGWIIIFAARPLKSQLPSISFLFLILGGIVYTAGCIFFALKKIRWMHTIWHFFVLGGSILHFFSMYYSL
ncbi:hemolysin III family protein [Treponema phagedenis]|uniref:Hemolysin III family protein n=2 Tax=Treponema phagedenis TaxID=162 RepID=A0AAE6IWE9_TREPH|nr:hemolysin III family protein [Treponema phagedenis]QEJ96424.1 hemolysin III family protein [Treponema phagedenis]QEJ99590.1 hemolysin III family protein [Treponema phagedenis]QEK02295.1 hemolysin III family protein [Treponema phagedenis]QEK05140.1 hemolysin III family protein [Treponema phagedenis]